MDQWLLEVLHGEGDARTVEAIEDGRRLYVGNFPYIAKVYNHVQVST